MKIDSPLRVFVFLLCIFVQTVHASSIIIKQAWIPEAPPVAPVLAGYLQIQNTGQKAVTLNKVESHNFERVEIHRSVEKEGMIRMEQVRELTIPAQSMINLKSGGLHLMLMEPKQALRADDRVILEFIFSDNQRVSIQAEVRSQMRDGAKHPHR